MMEQIIKQNMFSRTLFNESKLGAYYTDPVHAAKIGRLFRLQGECCVLEPSFGNAEALKAFLSQCERADEAGSVHTFGVELNRETFEQYLVRRILVDATCEKHRCKDNQPLVPGNLL